MAGKRSPRLLARLWTTLFFNYLGEIGEAWGQNTNDYLPDTPLAAAAPQRAFWLYGPDITAGVATGGAGAGMVRGGKAFRKAHQAGKGSACCA